MELTSKLIRSQKETKMFTISSTTRETNLYLTLALAIMLVLILSLAVVPSMAAPKSDVVPVTGVSQYTDYYQRHPELRAPAALMGDTTDYFMRHPEMSSSRAPNDLSDYFLRH
jgi:hypothetical protein